MLLATERAVHNVDYFFDNLSETLNKGNRQNVELRLLTAPPRQQDSDSLFLISQPL